MDNLVKIENGQIVVSSRDIAKHFEKEHKNVIQSIEKLKAENSALTPMFYETSYRAGTGKAYKEYLMNRDGFSLLVMGFTGAKALEWKLKYIAAFNEMEKKLREQQQIMLPKDYLSALKALVVAEEEKQKLLAENEEMKPKAAFYDDVTGSSDTIDIKSAAKVLNIPNMGRNKLFAFLRDNHVLNKRNEPYQYFVDRGYFRQVESSWEHDGTVHISLKTVVFQKGIDFIRGLIAKNLVCAS